SGGVRGVIPVEFRAIHHFIIINQLLNRCVASPVMITIRAVCQSRQSTIFPSAAFNEIAAEDRFLAILQEEHIGIVFNRVSSSVLDLIDSKVHNCFGGVLCCLPFGGTVTGDRYQFGVSVSAGPAWIIV